MKNLSALLIVILFQCVSSLCSPTENTESKESKKPNEVEKKNKPKQGDKFKNSIGMEFIYIEPGKFMMGSSKQITDELTKKYEEPYGIFESEKQHEVELTKGFYIQTTEITVGQFKKFVEAGKYITDSERDEGAWIIKNYDIEQDKDANWRNPGFEQGNEHPVTCVSWNDAKAFCEWLNDNEDDTKGIYRLPTEAEWEYACRAGEKGAFQWGDDADEGKGWGNMADLSFMDKFEKGVGLEKRKSKFFNWRDGYVYTSPVGKFKANRWGLYNMVGNVEEWCEDCYDERFYHREEAKKDPCNESFGEKEFRVLRGGSWDRNPVGCRPAYRNSALRPYQALNCGGFRVVLTSE